MIRQEKVLDLACIILAAGIWLLLAILGLGRFEAFNVYGIDYALFDQVIWNTARGHLLENTIIQDARILLAQRFSPILFAFVPIYSLWSDPRVLVFVPAAAVVVAAFPLYWFARRRIGRSLALLVVFAFLTAPGLQVIGSDQFKEVVLAIPFLMLATTFLLEREYVPFSGSLALAMLCKEEMGFVAAAFGVYIFVIQRRYAFGAGLAIVGVAWVIVLIQVVIPHFRGGGAYYYFGGSGYYGSGLYDYLGNNVWDIVVNLITRPDIVLTNVLTPGKVDAATKILLPFGIFALPGLDVFLLALPTLAYTLLSNRVYQFQFGSYHYAPVYVFLFVALVVGLERVIRRCESRGCILFALRRAIRIGLGALILVSSLSTYRLNAIGPLSRNFDASRYMPTAHDRLGAQLASSIPQTATVLAQTELVSFLGQRRNLFVDLPWACLSNMDYIFADTKRQWYAQYQEV